MASQLAKDIVAAALEEDALTVRESVDLALTARAQTIVESAKADFGASLFPDENEVEDAFDPEDEDLEDEDFDDEDFEDEIEESKYSSDEKKFGTRENPSGTSNPNDEDEKYGRAKEHFKQNLAKKKEAEVRKLKGFPGNEKRRMQQRVAQPYLAALAKKKAEKLKS